VRLLGVSNVVRSAERVLRIAVIVVALAVVGCGGGGGKAKPAPPTRTIVADALQRTAKLKSFHFVLKVEHAPTGVPGLTLTLADGDLLVPDQLQARVNGTFGRAPIQTDIVIAGSRSLLKDPITNQWRLFSAGTNPGVLVKGVPSLLRSATAVRNTGSEKVGGADCYRLEGMVRSADVAPLVGVKPGARQVPFTVWIDKADSYLRRIRLDGPVADGEPQDIVRTVELSNFDKPVTIAQPKVSG
jgi:hypothetical protein